MKQEKHDKLWNIINQSGSKKGEGIQYDQFPTEIKFGFIRKSLPDLLFPFAFRFATSYGC